MFSVCFGLREFAADSRTSKNALPTYIDVFAFFLALPTLQV